MSEQQRGRSTSQDFAFQSTDQSYAHRFGGAEEATQQAFSAQQQHQRYAAHAATNAPRAPTTPTHSSPLDQSLRHPEFAVQRNSVPQAGASAPLQSGYGFNPSAALAWDWGSTIGFVDYPPRYEPQGELAQELQTQHAPTATDFSIPLPLTVVNANANANVSSLHPSPGPVLPAQSSAVQNPFSPPPKPTHRLSVQTSMKRKVDSEPDSGTSQAPNGSFDEKPSKRQAKSRASSVTSVTSPSAPAATATSLPASMTGPIDLENTAPSSSETHKRKEPSKGTGPQGRVIDVSEPRRVVESRGNADILPSGKVFPIQIGSELFRLSGASISSDAPSYFSHFFGEQLHSNQGRAGDVRTLYIDRDPETFRDIALHLQGYHVNPRNGEHFVRLYADAQFYSLPRLTKQLFSTDIFIRIGGVPFQIPRDLFSSPGDSPNYFSLGFAQFFSTPSEVFPGLDRNALLRPPPISPPSVPNRNGETFGELIQMLQGYEVDIRNDAHRSQLLRDARYFHLRGLEQRLIPCATSYNLRRGQSEILIRLHDIRQSGISFTPDAPVTPSESQSVSNSTPQLGLSPAPLSKVSSPGPSQSSSQFRPGTISYARPYTDDHASTNVLILELSSEESTTLHLPAEAPSSASSSEPFTLDLRATFHGTTLARITSLFSVIASKMGLPATQPLGLMLQQTGGGVAAQPVSPANSGVSERRVRVRLDPECYLEVDNAPAELAVDPRTNRIGIRRVGGERSMHKRIKRSEDQAGCSFEDDDNDEWIWGGAREGQTGHGEVEEVEGSIVVKRAHWRIRVENVEGEAGKMVVVLVGVRLEGYSGEKARNQGRGFLGG